MNAIVYRNTKSTIPGWVPTLYVTFPRGMAFENATHFVHYYGQDSSIWTIPMGPITVSEQKQGTLEDWVIRTFGAQDIEQSIVNIGETIEGIWRPGIASYEDIRQGLGTTDAERHQCLQSIRLLIERLDEIFLYVEPSSNSLKTYSHKIRDLLILACTEVESNWSRYLRVARATPVGKDFTTKDYVKLLSKLYLAEFEINIKPYPAIAPIRPFDGWDQVKPTQSLPWYEAYNLTKHDRQSNFSLATLEHCLSAVCANLVLFCVRFSPLPLYQEGGTVAALCNQFFDVKLVACSPTTFYVRSVNLPAGRANSLICFDCVQDNVNEPWVVTPFTL